MKSFTLQATKREIQGKKVAILREEKLIPAVLYGYEINSTPISVQYQPFQKIYREAGESSLIDLVVGDNAALKVLIHGVDTDPLSDRYIHIDFYRVNMTQKLTVRIPLAFIGESKAVKELGGILVKTIDEIEVRCLPDKLVSEISIDISPLATFDDAITIKDIVLPEGIELHEGSNDVIATVTQPISEEELKALEEKPIEDVSQIKVEEKGKKEEEE